MALGRQSGERQQEFWIACGDLPRSAGHPFYERLERLLIEEDFDETAEEHSSLVHKILLLAARIQVAAAIGIPLAVAGGAVWYWQRRRRRTAASLDERQSHTRSQR